MEALWERGIIALENYYATDWLAILFTLLSLYFLGNKKKIGFVFGALASLCWLLFGVLAGSIASPLANCLFIAMNMRGFLKWEHNSTNSEA